MRTLNELQNVRLGDMTPEERHLVTDSAVRKLEREINHPGFKAAVERITIESPPAAPPFHVSGKSILTCVQRGLSGRNPWVEARFEALAISGKILTETTAADGNSYMLVRFPRLSGLYLFRIDGDSGARHAHTPRLLVTLFAIL